MSKNKFILKDKTTSVAELINHDFICKICNKKFKGSTYLGVHVKRTHKIKYIDYLKKYFNVDINAINKKWDSFEERQKRKQKQTDALKKHIKENVKGISFKDRIGEESYKKFRKNMKGVFSKEWFVSKFGEDEGLQKYNARSINLSKNTYWIQYNKENNQNWSNISQELFWEIYKRIHKRYKNIYFGELNHEFGCGTNTNFDFVVVDNKKIIEFNGDKFHANPKIFKENDIPIKFLKNTAKEIWEHDIIKNEKAKEKGYDIKVIWESEYLKNKEKIILKCIDFINEYENS